MNGDALLETDVLQALFRDHGLERWADLLPEQLAAALAADRHGDLRRWQQLLALLPEVKTRDLDLGADRVRVGRADEVEADLREEIHRSLRAFQPWRKGPFELFGINIDSEWRSDWKWARLAPHIQPLAGRRVLDVGCGNGYYAWRMAAEGAELVVGIDPGLLFLAQFRAIRHFMAAPPPVQVLPLGIEAVPAKLHAFDTVFSMGVLYHRRSPMEHLETLRGCLRPGGELVLETLVVEGDERQVLVPRGRYAKMRNVWFIPSPAALQIWLERSGFGSVRVVDVTPTTTGEQRSTDWMGFESLADFLDPDDPSRTLEGYPAPLRAVVTAEA